MIKKPKLFVLILVISNFSFYSCKSQKADDKFISAKNTVLKVFQMTKTNNYDSLKSIVVPFENKTNESIKNNFEFNTIKLICDDEGVPAFSELYSQPLNHANTDICIVRFIPKRPDSVETDSIIFKFDKFSGLKRVSFIDVSKKIQSLKTH